MIQSQKYARKPYYADAVEVTEENFEEVAAWCQGEIIETAHKHEQGKTERHIRVRVHRPINDRQTRAFVGDFLVYLNGYKVYPAVAFHKSFEKVHILTKEQADQAGIHPPIEKRAPKKPEKKGPVPRQPSADLTAKKPEARRNPPRKGTKKRSAPAKGQASPEALRKLAEKHKKFD